MYKAVKATLYPNQSQQEYLAKSFGSARWYWNIEVNRFFPSSKTCNHCLCQIGEIPLDIRSWQCSSCGTTHDRDVNAAKNIRQVDEVARRVGLRMIQTLGTSDMGVAARRVAFCPGVRQKSGRKKSTLLQECWRGNHNHCLRQNYNLR